MKVRVAYKGNELHNKGGGAVCDLPEGALRECHLQGQHVEGQVGVATLQCPPSSLLLRIILKFVGILRFRTGYGVSLLNGRMTYSNETHSTYGKPRWRTKQNFTH